MSLKKNFFSIFLLIAVSALICAQDVSQFKHWSTTKVSSITQKPWSNSNNIISGWDWSLPTGTTASSNACVTIKDNINPGMSCKNLEQIWVKWKEMEPNENNYRWDSLRTLINASVAKGYSGVVLRVWGAVWDVKNYPDSTSTNTKWPIGTKSAPRWLRSAPYNVPLIKMTPSGNPGSQIINCDIMDAVYHEKYKKFIRAFGASGIPAMPEVAITYVCYRSHTMGEEFTAYKTGESTATMEEIAQRTKERIDVWVEAFGVNKRKLIYVAEDVYASTVGIGTRGGFIEMYNQFVHYPSIGQYVDANRYLTVDENNPFIKNGAAFGDENEEYDPNDARFGKPEAIGYRYMMSTLMMVKMRRNFAMLARDTPNPELLYWAGLEFGRTITDAPDAWCWLNECYIKWVGSAGPIKNVERWLIQRDSLGYETEPYYQVQNTQWYADSSRPYDYVCRRAKGLKMGFALDDRFITETPQRVAVKITYYDGIAGKLKLVYNDGTTVKYDSITANGVDAFKTATIFITGVFKAKGTAYDFEIQSPERVPVNMVRVIPIPQGPYLGVIRTIPGTIECEHYDEGGQGVAYNDDATKSGDLTFRPTDNVDVVVASGASNGYKVGVTYNNEWLEYTVNTVTGNYDISLKYYCGAPTLGQLIVSLDNVNIATFSSIPNLGWAVLQTKTINNVAIPGGSKKVLKLAFSGGAGFHLDAINFSTPLAKVRSSNDILDDANQNTNREIEISQLSGNVLNVKSNKKQIDEVRVYSIVGQLLYNKTTNTSSVQINLNALSSKSNSFIIKVIAGGVITTHKVLINR